MGITSIKSVYIATFQLKGVAQTWCNLQKEDRGIYTGLVYWDEFVNSFIDRFLN